MASYKLTFSNSNNVWYDVGTFDGTEIEMLKHVNWKLHHKPLKLYNCWIYDANGNRMYNDYNPCGSFRRGKKIIKLIEKLEKTQ